MSSGATNGPTLVVGLGNPVLGDDAVGWAVLEALETELGREGRAAGGAIELDWLAVGGLTLMERLVGVDRAVLVDAVTTGADPIGTVRVRPLDDVALRGAGHLDSAHDASLAEALVAGRALGALLPEEVVVVTVEAERVDTFGTRLSPPVAAAVAPAVAAVLDALEAHAHA